MKSVEEKKEVVLQTSDFVHLHNHTHYSLLDGLTKIPELVDFVKEHGMEAVAVTDHGTMSGLVELYKTCKEKGIKPILGLEAYVAARNLEDRDPAHDKQRFHITLLAMNDKGFENLCRLMSNAEINGKYYKLDTNGNLTIDESKKNKRIILPENKLIYIKENRPKAVMVESGRIELHPSRDGPLLQVTYAIIFRFTAVASLMPHSLPIREGLTPLPSSGRY